MVNALSYSFDRVVVEAVFDAHSFLALAEIADDFASEALGHCTIQWNVPTEETHDVGAAEGGHRMLEQARIEAAQLISCAEGDVDGPRALIGRPVVRRGMSSEDVVVDRVHCPSDAIQQRGPFDGELLIHQLLRRRPVFDPWKTVAVTQVVETRSDHLVC